MPTTRIIHLTDPHTTSLARVGARDLLSKRALGYLSWRRKRRHRHTQHMLDATVTAALAKSPDALVLTGDLLHIGLASEMQQIRPWLQALADQLPVLLVPGNHDLYAADSQELWQQELGDLPVFGTAVNADRNYPRALQVNQVRILGLSSAYAAPLTRADGKLGEHQRQELNRLLADAPNHQEKEAEATLLALHHPAEPTLAKERKSLLDAQELQHLMRRHQHKLTALVHGHLHENLSYSVAGTPCYCTASASSTDRNAMASFRLLEFTGATVNCRLFTADASADDQQTEHVEFLERTPE